VPVAVDGWVGRLARVALFPVVAVREYGERFLEKVSIRFVENLGFGGVAVGAFWSNTCMGTTATLTSLPETAAGVLCAARDRRRVAETAEAELLALAVRWAVLHPAEAIHVPATHRLRGFAQTDLALAGPGAPTVAEYSVAEFAAAVGLSTEAGKRYLGEALELGYRLPRTWARVGAGDLPGWKARLVARETVRLTAEAAGYVDRHVAGVAHRLKPAQLDRVVNEAIGRYMPAEVLRLAAESWDRRHVTIHDQLVSFTGTMHLEAELDIADALDLDAAVAAGAADRAALGSTESWDVRRAQAVGDLARRQLALDLAHSQGGTAGSGRVKPRQVILYLHLSHAAVAGSPADPVARLERGDALVTVEQVRAWCGHADAQITLKPVIDLDTCTQTDSDVVSGPIAERVALRDKTCVFPWCTRPARSCRPDDPDHHPCDGDHVIARARGGPTCTCNIAPLCRRHHRLKTHTPWTYLVLDPGSYLWTSPHGYQFHRDPTGTQDVSSDQPHPPDT
jgi:hypothetical protein